MKTSIGKRAIAIAMSFMMIFAFMPTMSFAGETEYPEHFYQIDDSTDGATRIEALLLEQVNTAGTTSGEIKDRAYAKVYANSQDYDGTAYDGANVIYSDNWEDLGFPEVKIEYFNYTLGDVTTKLKGAPTEAGSYAALFYVEDDSYLKDGDLSSVAVMPFDINPGKAALKVAPKAINPIYNGQDQELVTAGEAEHAKVVYSLTKDGTYTDEIPTARDADTYTVWYKLVATDENYTVPAVSGSVECAIIDDSWSFEFITGGVKASNEQTDVTPQARIMLEDQAYDGTAYDGVKIDYDDAWTAEALPEITVKYYDENKKVIAAPTEVGTYYVELSIAGINQVGEFDITAADAEVTYVPEAIEDLVYTGDAQELVTAGEGMNGKFYFSDAEDGVYKEEIPTGTDAGDYTVFYKFVADDNYALAAEVKGSVDVVIDAAIPDYTAPKAIDGLVYKKGIPQKLIEAGSCEDGAILYAVIKEGTLDDVTWSLEVPAAIDADVYTVVYKIKAFNDNYMDVDPTNVDITGDIMMLTAQIAKAAPVITAAPEGIEAPETGFEQPLTTPSIPEDIALHTYYRFVEWTGVDDEAEVQDEDWSADIPAATEPGKYFIQYAIAEGIDDDGKLISENYDLVSGTFVSEIFAIDHDWAYTINYDGDTVTATCGTDHECELGTLKAKLSVEAITKEYDGTATEATLTVDEDWTDENGLSELSKIYYYDADDAVLLTAPCKVGKYTAKVFFDDETGAEQEIAVAFEITAAESDVIAPTGLELTYKEGVKQQLIVPGEAIGGTMLYAVSEDGTVPEDDAFTKDIPLETELGQYFVYYKVDGGDNYAGTEPEYVISFIVEAEAEAAAEDEDGKVVGDFVKPQGKELVYNGDEQILVVPGYYKDSKLVYSLDPEAEDDAWVAWKDITAETAGEYTIYFKAEDDNYILTGDGVIGGIGSVETVIGQKEIHLEWTKDKFIYDGKKHLPDFSIKGIVAGDDVTVEIATPVEAIDAGDYTATLLDKENCNNSLTGDDAANYCLAADTETAHDFFIAKREVTIAVKSEFDHDYTYDYGEELDDEVFLAYWAQEYYAGGIIPDFDRQGFVEADYPQNIKVTVEGVEPGDLPDAGEYDITIDETPEQAEKANRNYEINFVGGTLTINKVEINTDPTDPNCDIQEGAFPGTVKDLTYNAEKQELIYPGKTEVGTFMYCVNPESTDTENWKWTSKVPERKNAGSYDVYYYIKGDKNHLDTPIEFIGTTVIAKKAVKVEWGNAKFKYDSKYHIPKATAVGVCKGDKCKVTVTTEKKYPGTYTATAKALSNSNYKFAKKYTKKFVIQKSILVAKVVCNGKSSLKLSWLKVTGADKYKIYMCPCDEGDNIYHLAYYKTVSAKQASLIVKGLDSNRAYRFKVVAYCGDHELVESNLIHEYTNKWDGIGEEANVLDVTANTHYELMKVGKTFKLDVIQHTYKGKHSIVHRTTAPYRYLTSDATVAKVSASGKITAVGKGKCYVYVQAINGMWDRVIVEVK